MTLKSVRPRGTFHARLTRDAAAHRRDGQTYVLMNKLTDSGRDRGTVEIMFEDGDWMLATEEDLDPV